MKKDGVGGGRTITGLKFESRVTLEKALKEVPGYSMSGNQVFFKEQEVARLYKKHDLYKNLLEPNGIEYLRIISKKLLPDDAILVLKDKTLFIVEMKFQMVTGSVDEKLQTCDFKNKQYIKLLSSLGLTVKYVYVLSEWFKKEEYRDVLQYIQKVGCYYFFNEIPLNFLNLPVSVDAY